MGSSSGSGSRSRSGSGYLDPHRVHELFVRLMPGELLDYLDSIPGASRDLHCGQIEVLAKTLNSLVSRPSRLNLREKSKKISSWAQLARSHATASRLCARQMVGNPSSSNPDAGHSVHNSSSYSRRILNQELDSNDHKHSAVPEPLFASSSRNAETLCSLQENSHDVHRHASLHNQLSASSSRVKAAMPPLQANTSKESISSQTRHENGGVVSRHKATQPAVAPPLSPASGNRGRGTLQSRRALRPARTSTCSPPPTSTCSPPPTSPPRTSLTSPRRPCRRARRQLRACQRRIVTQPLEGSTAPPLIRRSARLATASQCSPDSWNFRQTIE